MSAAKVLGVLWLVLALNGCDYGTAPDEADDPAYEVATGALSTYVRTFYVSNPDGKSNRVRLTASITSGTGQLVSMSLTDSSPVFIEYLGMACSGQSCVKSKSLSCRNYGSMRVDVEYTGSVRPRLQYYFTNCN